jgi:predicted amidohydrolase YtcJ
VFHGGTVLTMDGRRPRADAVVVERGRIAEVGGRALLDTADATVVDLAGTTLVPAFIDAHCHLSIAALHPRWGDATAIADRDALLTAVRAQATAEPDAAWVRLHGWDDARTGYTPTRDDLDAAGIERPVLVAHASLHQGVASGAALDALGIGRGTPDPPGGEIARDRRGEPAGLLVERAWGEAHARSLAAYADPDRWADHIADHARGLLADGITAVHDAACSPAAEATYRAMAAARTLPVSVLAMPHPAALLSTDLGDRLDGPPIGDGDERLRVGPVKLFADGGVAIALDVAIGGRPLRMGMTMDDLEEAAVAAAGRGFRIAVHAMGNVGVDRALDAFDAVARCVGDGDHRFRLEHATVTAPAHWARLAALGAVAVVQPGFVEHVGDRSGGVAFDEHRWLAFAGLAEAGVVLAGSSDEPCAPRSPLWCTGKGISRTTSRGIRLDVDQSVGLEAWLHAYTAGAALAGGQEHERGRIAPGLVADLVALDLDGDAPTVRQTWRAGQLVYQATPPPTTGERR